MKPRVLAARLLACLLAGAAWTSAAAAPPLDLSAAAAWKGWARPGTETEIDLRIAATPAPAHATLELESATRRVHAEVDLGPGRGTRLQLPVPVADRIGVVATMAAAPTLRRELAIAPSESPLLAVALAAGATVEVEGFHAIAVGADDLPRHAAAYAAIDALIVDAATLAALDRQQLAALVAAAGACGRIVVVGADRRVSRLLEGAGGCGSRALLGAATPAEAAQALAASLQASLPAPLTTGAIGALAGHDLTLWNRLALALLVYFALGALALLHGRSLPMLLAAPLVAAALALGLPWLLRPQPRLLIWSEADSGTAVARYQAWQRVSGAGRGVARVELPAQLARQVRPCDDAQPLRLDYDVARALARAVEFETRLFGQTWLCYAGSFPVARQAALVPRGDTSIEVRNAGPQAWPAGWLLALGGVAALPALGPGAAVTLAPRPDAVAAADAAALRLASLRAGGRAALWRLELGAVAGAPLASEGWLMLALP
ncbi:MAG: hypothetical protein KGN16_00490 [Burkholderiales bacterium]|nr:hypothetical protein [Burkholderiales bacterium]